MKAGKLLIASGLMLAATVFTACEKDGSGDSLYGIEKKEIKEQDTRVFDEVPRIQAIEKKEIKERDT